MAGILSHEFKQKKTSIQGEIFQKILKKDYNSAESRNQKEHYNKNYFNG